MKEVGKLTCKSQLIGLCLIVIAVVIFISLGNLIINQAHAQQQNTPPLRIAAPPVVFNESDNPYLTPIERNPACTRWYDLNQHQQQILTKAYHYGKPYNLGFTMSAIALAESNAGYWRLNYRSNDFGIMQISIVTASNHLGVTNHFRQMELAERLVYDDELGFYLALQVLEHFRGNRVVTNQVWREMIMSYNEGYTWRRHETSMQKATQYANRVAGYVTMLRECTTW